MPKSKKNHVGILSRMLAALVATDAEPEILEEAVDAIEDITESAAAPAEPAAPAAPAEEAQDESPADPMAEIMARLEKLEAAIAAKGADEEPEEEEDPLKKLEDDLDQMEKQAGEEEPVTPDEDPDEQESHFVDPDEINEQDEDGEEEEVTEEESVDCKARDAMREAIKSIRPILASLPKAEQKKASDAMAASLRKAYGMTEKATRNDYLRLKARKRSDDSAKETSADLGRSIMEKRNPNYSK